MVLIKVRDTINSETQTLTYQEGDKMSIFRNKWFLISLLVIVAVLAVAASTMDMGTGLVKKEVSAAVEEQLDSTIRMDSVRGNPFRGYEVSGVAISTGEQEILTAEKINVGVSLMALITGAPPVSLIEIEGFDSNVERMNQLLSKIETGQGEGEIPVKKVRLLDSSFGTPFARAAIRDIALTFDRTRINADIDLDIQDVPLRGDVDVDIKEGAVFLEKMDLNVGDGHISAMGGLRPDLSLQGKMENLDVPRLASLWPGIDPDNFKGLFSTDLTAEGTWEAPNISGTLSFSGEKIAGIPLKSAEARWRYQQNRLDIADMKALLMGFPLEGHLAFVFEEDTPGRIMVDLQGSEADLSQLGELDPRFADLTGRVNEFTLNLKGDINEPTGSISFKAEKLAFRGYSLSGTDVNADIKKGLVDLKGSTSLMGAKISLGGKVTDFPGDARADIKGSLRSLSLKELKVVLPALSDIDPAGSLDADYKIQGSLSEPLVSGKIWSQKLALMEQTFSNPSLFFEYHKDDLNFSSLKTAWRDTQISGEGKISEVSSPERKGDIIVNAAGLDSEFLEGFHPPVKEYGLKGELTASVNITGKLSEPSLKLALSSNKLSIQDNFSFQDLKAETFLKEITGEMPSDLSISLSAGSAALQGIGMSGVNMNIVKKGDNITLSDGRANLGKGTITAGGEMVLQDPMENSTMDISARGEDLDLSALSTEQAGKMPVQGIFTGDLSVKGTVADPSIDLKLSSPQVTASGMTVEKLSLVTGGNMENMKIQDLSAMVGKGSFQVTGDVSPVSSTADLKLEGKALDIKVLTSSFPKMKQLDLKGDLDLEFNGHFEQGNNTGSGKASSDLISVKGMRFTDLLYPLDLKENRLSTSNASGLMYGGKIEGNGYLDLADLSFNKDLEVNGIDVDSLLQDVSDMEGRITGKANVFAKIAGSMKDGLEYRGRGLLKTGEGSISGFKAIKLVAALHGMKDMKFASVYAPFNLDTGKLELKEDTMIKAFEGDPLYRFISAMGPVGPENKLDLSCKGNVNIRVLNALLGGAAGGISSAGDLAGMLSGALQGAGGQMKKDDFRDVSLKIGGTFDKPKVSNINVQKKEAPQEEQTLEEPVKEKSPDKTIQEQVQEKISPDTQKEESKEEPEDVEEKIKKEIIKKIFE